MNTSSQDLGSIVSIVLRCSIGFVCLLHALFILYVVRQVMNLENLLSTLSKRPLIIFGTIHAIILLVLLIIIFILP